MGHVIELCRTCGFEIPVDAEGCPGCRHHDVAPSLAARQVAGLALPTRSVHRLSTTRTLRELPEPAEGPARVARTAFSFTSTIVLIAILGGALSWILRVEGFVLALPEGLIQAIDHLTVAAAWASLIGLGAGLCALVVRVVRRLVILAAHRVMEHSSPA